MDEIELRERIKKIIKEALTEANTINNGVEEKALEIYNIVCKKKLTDSDVTNKTCPDGTVQKIYSIHDKFLEKNILWTFRACMVNEDSYYEKLQQHETSFGTTYTDGNKITFITITYYQTGKIFDKAEVFDSIQHELNHTYKALLVGKTMENDQFCAYINTLVNLPPLKENYYQKIIGDICYIGRKDEQDSFINGAYVFLKEKQPIETEDIKSALEQTALFSMLKRITEIKTQWTNLSKNIIFQKSVENIPKGFKIDMQKLEKWMDSAIKRLQTKTGSMLTAYNRYLYGKGYHSSNGKPPISWQDF